MMVLAVVLLLSSICASFADPLPLDSIGLPPGFSVNVFTNATPKARSLAVSGGDSNIVYISNDLLVTYLPLFVFAALTNA